MNIRIKAAVLLLAGASVWAIWAGTASAATAHHRHATPQLGLSQLIDEAGNYAKYNSSANRWRVGNPAYTTLNIQPVPGNQGEYYLTDTTDALCMDAVGTSVEDGDCSLSRSHWYLINDGNNTRFYWVVNVYFYGLDHHGAIYLTGNGVGTDLVMAVASGSGNQDWRYPAAP